MSREQRGKSKRGVAQKYAAVDLRHIDRGDVAAGQRRRRFVQRKRDLEIARKPVEGSERQDAERNVGVEQRPSGCPHRAVATPDDQRLTALRKHLCDRIEHSFGRHNMQGNVMAVGPKRRQDLIAQRTGFPVQHGTGALVDDDVNLHGFQTQPWPQRFPNAASTSPHVGNAFSEDNPLKPGG